MSFQSDLAYGEQGELFVLKKLHYKYPKAYKVEGYCKEWDLFVPEKNIGVEVKSDRATHKTGNVVIENKYGGAPSGIETTKATWWAYITKDNLYWITPDKIKECIKDNNLQSLDCAPLNGDTKRKNLYLIKETLFKEYTTSSEKINGRN
jgi:hypothetical protein|tara:strand:- start:790 stop:1236 length:447 start_codon:yes stop_codon:yes gene_type:complete